MAPRGLAVFKAGQKFWPLEHSDRNKREPACIQLLGLTECSETSMEKDWTCNSRPEALSCQNVLQLHLLPRLPLSNLLRLEAVDVFWQHQLASAPEEVWRAALSRMVPPDHRLAGVVSDCRQAAHDFAADQTAIRFSKYSITYAWVYAHTFVQPDARAV